IYEVDVPPRQQREVSILLPLHQQQTAATTLVKQEADATNEWRRKLNRVEFEVPEDGQVWIDALRSSIAHVLINRDGPAIQPGSRAYERSWIRDGAMTSEMLLRLGHDEVVREFLQWFAGYQFENGKVPCCVDRRGADPVPEN